MFFADYFLPELSEQFTVGGLPASSTLFVHSTAILNWLNNQTHFLYSEIIPKTVFFSVVEPFILYSGIGKISSYSRLVSRMSLEIVIFFNTLRFLERLCIWFAECHRKIWCEVNTYALQAFSCDSGQRVDERHLVERLSMESPLWLHASRIAQWQIPIVSDNQQKKTIVGHWKNQRTWNTWKNAHFVIQNLNR